MKLTFEKVNCIYDPDATEPVRALSGIDLSIGSGEFIGLIGHTGSGKSTLVQHMNGLLRPTGGRILADGADIWGEHFDRKKLRARVGLVFQYPEHQLFEADILSDACFGPKNCGQTPEEAEAAAREALRQVGIDESLFSSSPFDLSGGQKRRVAIAGVLAMQPEILILDEPTAGLDPRGRREILSLIKRLHDQNGITIVLVSHSMEDVARFADRLLVMEGGRLLYDDAPAKVFSHDRELEAVGLRIPETIALLRKLKNAGFPDIDTSALTAEDAAAAILRAIGMTFSDTRERRAD